MARRYSTRSSCLRSNERQSKAAQSPSSHIDCSRSKEGSSSTRLATARRTADNDQSQKSYNREEYILRKLQSQQDKLEELSTNLSKSRAENQALKAKQVELATEIPFQIVVQNQSVKSLKEDAARLQKYVGALRKTFQSHMKDNQRRSLADKESIEKLQRENRALRRWLNVSDKMLTTHSVTFDSSCCSGLSSNGRPGDKGDIIINMNDEVLFRRLSTFSKRTSCTKSFRETK